VPSLTSLRYDPVPFLRRAWNATLDLVFPPACGICGAEGSFLCRTCETKLRPALPPRCPRCWRTGGGLCRACEHTSLDGARALYVFEAGARALVYQLKYHFRYALAEPMGEHLALYLEREPLPVDLVVPVPLHRRRQRWRGFNQAELLGRVVAARTGLDLDQRLLRRRRSTIPQISQNGRQREENVRDAFICQQGVEGRHVLLVDDVLTTGATIRECARTLRRAGAASVWALTFARED
jgi:ComF family protein